MAERCNRCNMHSHDLCDSDNCVCRYCRDSPRTFFGWDYGWRQSETVLGCEFRMNSERYGFRRGLFPQDFRGHRLVLLDNEGRMTVDDRLAFHLTLHCTRCKQEQTIRGRLPPKQSSERKMAYMKLATLGGFRDTCPEASRKVYYGSSHTP